MKKLAHGGCSGAGAGSFSENGRVIAGIVVALLARPRPICISPDIMCIITNYSSTH